MNPTLERTPYQRVKDLLQHALIYPSENCLHIVRALRYRDKSDTAALAAQEAELLRLIQEREQGQ